MFSSLTHLLTLFAFAVHAVLGCCAHHSHVTGGGCCQHVLAHPCDSHCDCDADHDHAHEGCQHQHDCSDSSGDLASESSIVSHGATCCCDLPGDHSHSCNEARCAYVVSSLVTVDFGDSGVVGYLDFASSIGCLVSPRVCTDLPSCWPVQRGHSSSAHLCADLQSWQI